jgi:transposase InsO family protein
MIDAGGEFKSNKLRMFLKELGINILTSVPHMHQQNGCAERFIRTIVEKAQAIRLEACIHTTKLAGVCCKLRCTRLQLYPPQSVLVIITRHCLKDYTVQNLM